MLQKSTRAHYFCALLRSAKQKKVKRPPYIYIYLKGDDDDDDYNNHNDIDVFLSTITAQLAMYYLYHIYYNPKPFFSFPEGLNICPRSVCLSYLYVYIQCTRNNNPLPVGR